MHRSVPVAAAALLVLGTASSLSVGAPIACPAVPGATCFFGEDQGLGELTRLTLHPNADAARTEFLANLIGVSTQTFEAFPDGTGAPLALSFAGAGTATLQGGGFVNQVVTGTDGLGRFPISGTKYWDTRSDFLITFSEPVAAFGFYGIDIGDFQGQLTLTLADGASHTVVIPHSVPAAFGSVLYFGIIDTTSPFESASFGTTTASDSFGFDDMTIGALPQVSEVAEPASSLLVGSGLALLAAISLRRR